MQHAERFFNKDMTQRMTIRVGRGTLSFAMPDVEGHVAFQPYVVKSGVSMAANLREAFKSQDYLKQLPEKARVLVDADVLMMPVALFEEEQMDTVYGHAFPCHQQDAVFFNVLSNLNAVAISSVNKDLRLVVNDHFDDVRLITAISPVWNHLHQRSFTGSNQKLYGYVHEHRLEVFAFQQNRFRFCNSFDIKHTRDTCYFLLYVWNQLQLQPQTDELHLVGDLFLNESPSNLQEREEVLKELRRFLKKVFVINPSADFNRAQVTEIKGMPYDLQTLFVKGR